MSAATAAFSASPMPAGAFSCADAASLRIPTISRSGRILWSFSASSNDSQMASAAVPAMSLGGVMVGFAFNRGGREAGVDVPGHLAILGPICYAQLIQSSVTPLFSGVSARANTPLWTSYGATMLTQQSPLSRKLSAFVALSDVDLATLARFDRRRRSFQPGHEMIHEGQANASAFVLSQGWACSYKLLPDGERQIVDFQIPGDFLGLRSILFRTADHSIEALTRIEASEVLASDILDAFAVSPRLAAAVLWAASRDEAMVVEHLVNLGRRSAEERTAHFLLELGARLSLVGIGDRTGFDCPLTQYHLADALGLSAVHVNRVLRNLREEGLATFQKGRVAFDDFGRLKTLAAFDTAYLDQGGPLLR